MTLWRFFVEIEAENRAQAIEQIDTFISGVMEGTADMDDIFNLIKLTDGKPSVTTNNQRCPVGYLDCQHLSYERLGNPDSPTDGHMGYWCQNYKVEPVKETECTDYSPLKTTNTRRNSVGYVCESEGCKGLVHEGDKLCAIHRIRAVHDRVYNQKPSEEAGQK